MCGDVAGIDGGGGSKVYRHLINPGYGKYGSVGAIPFPPFLRDRDQADLDQGGLQERYLCETP